MSRRDQAPERQGSRFVETEPLSEEDLAMLMRNAGPRRAAPERVKHEVFASTEEAWRRVRRRRSRRRWLAAAAVLAATALGLALLLGRAAPPAEDLEVASAARDVAVLEAWFGDLEATPFALGESRPGGSEITTLGGERAALRLGDALSLRLGEQTRVRLRDVATVELLLGTLYVDTGLESGSGPAAEPAIEILSRLGRVTDVGTQFEVSLGGDQLSVRVREGRVLFESTSSRVEAAAGREIRVDRAGVAATAALSSTDFAWAVETAPVGRLRGRALAEILRWVERETGVEVRYESADLAREAETIRAGGSLDGLRPGELPEILLPAAGLVARREGNVLWVSRRSG